MSIFNQIVQYNSVFSQEQTKKILDNVKEFKWGIQRSGNPSSKGDNPFWMLRDLENDSFFKDELVGVIERLTGNKFSVLQIYLNAQFSTQDAFPHIDGAEKDLYTFLVYMNRSWDFTWGGETIFLDRYMDTDLMKDVKNSDSVYAVLPKPNKGIMFPGNIYHYAKGPSTFFHDLRITLAFKLFKI